VKNAAHATQKLKTVTLYFLLIFLCICILLPIYFAFILSSHNVTTAMKWPPPFWLGEELSTNFIKLFTATSFLNSVLNSIIIVAASIATQVFFCTMAGFAFARYDFAFKKFFFFLILATLMIPQFVNIVPFYSLMVALGWVNTFLPLIVPTMASAFGIYLMREYIEQLVPNDLINAGQIDGLGHFQTLMQVVFPSVQPAIGVVATMAAVTAWNDFMLPVLVLSKPELYTIPLWVHDYTGKYEFGTAWLACVISVLPLFIIFAIFAKKFIRNLVSGSIKG
jgi:multiple sugar transport system permease protein